MLNNEINHYSATTGAGTAYPSNDKDKNCLYIDKDHGTWSAEQCDEEFYFICQHTP
jgi:hypothetical protein